MPDLLTIQRVEFHDFLKKYGVLSLDGNIASNADKSQKTSVDIASHICAALNVPISTKLPGQKAGKLFEDAVQHFLRHTFPHFSNLRPGRWTLENFGSSRRGSHISRYEPFTHLSLLAEAIGRDKTLESVLGNSYEISPDVVVVRKPEPDSSINAGAISSPLVGPDSGLHSIIRKENGGQDIIHAIISCKWTLRSDRAQNARSEALNIIRNRKGRTPHIAVVTGEPTPSRLASLALGTGDIDMVYHFALPELQAAVQASGNDEAQSMLDTLIEGNRLRDISDLVLDLCV